MNKQTLNVNDIEVNKKDFHAKFSEYKKYSHFLVINTMMTVINILLVIYMIMV